LVALECLLALIAQNSFTHYLISIKIGVGIASKFPGAGTTGKVYSPRLFKGNIRFVDSTKFLRFMLSCMSLSLIGFAQI
jgi:hypothetical protein